MTVEEAARSFLAAVDEYPPEVSENAWRIGGWAQKEWRERIRDLREAVSERGGGAE